LKKLIARRKNFAQLEDFNSGSKNEEYHKEYMARMAGEKRGGEKPGYSDESSGMKKRKKQAAAEDSKKKSPPSEGPKIRKRAKKWAEALPWANTENTNVLYSLIESNEVDALEEMISTNPDVVHSRSEDGRGPLWWAYEFKRTDVIDLLTKYKVRTDLTDVNGKFPHE
jgi:dolichyl-diphosphooligosaccharide--protein glycosyltransferase